jgi:hypothetical protein
LRAFVDEPDFPDLIWSRLDFCPGQQTENALAVSPNASEFDYGVNIFCLLLGFVLAVCLSIKKKNVQNGSTFSTVVI